ncbi:MAG: hypothetical protein WCR42_00200 [bacterium]
MNLLQISRTILLILIISTFGELKAQDPNSPIALYYNYNKKEIGAFIGIGQGYTNGFIQVDCPECEFEKAVGANLRIGGLYEQSDSKFFGFGLFAALNTTQLKSSYIQLETVTLQNTKNEKVDASFRNSVTVNLKHFAAGAYVVFKPTKIFFLQAGASFMLPIGSSLIQEKELLTNTAKLSNGLIVKLAIDPTTGNSLVGSDTKKAILQNSKYPNLGVPVYADFAAGLELAASKKVVICPMIEFSLPLLPTASVGDNFTVGYWRLSVKVKYNFFESNSDY